MKTNGIIHVMTLTSPQINRPLCGVRACPEYSSQERALEELEEHKRTAQGPRAGALSRLWTEIVTPNPDGVSLSG